MSLDIVTLCAEMWSLIHAMRVACHLLNHVIFETCASLVAFVVLNTLTTITHLKPLLKEVIPPFKSVINREANFCSSMLASQASYDASFFMSW